MSVETLNIFGSNPCDASSGHKTPLQERLIKGIMSFLATMNNWNERQRSRHQLAQLDDRMLSDIGLSRADVVDEIEKPFWVR